MTTAEQKRHCGVLPHKAGIPNRCASLSVPHTDRTLPTTKGIDTSFMISRFAGGISNSEKVVLVDNGNWGRKAKAGGR